VEDQFDLVHSQQDQETRRVTSARTESLAPVIGHAIKTTGGSGYFNQKSPKVEYGLTAFGKTLIPVIEVTAQWGETHRHLLEPLFQSTTPAQ
jgi:hypothetical protein